MIEGSEPKLSKKNKKILRKAAYFFIGDKDGLRDRVLDDAVLHAERVIFTLPKGNSIFMRIALRLFNYMPILLGIYPLSFLLLGEKKALRFLEKVAHHRFFVIREIIRGIKGMIIIGAYASPYFYEVVKWPLEEHVQEKIKERNRRKYRSISIPRPISKLEKKSG